MIVAVHIKTANLEKTLESIHIPAGWELHTFMDAANKFTSSATGIPLEKFPDRDFMNSYLGPEWSYMREERFVRGQEVNRQPVKYFLTPKIILTKIYELGREIHSSFWVNALLQNYTPEKKWVVALMYPNEFAAVKDLGAYTIFYDSGGMRGMLDKIKDQFDQVVRDPDAFEVLLSQKLK